MGSACRYLQPSRPLSGLIADCHQPLYLGITAVECGNGQIDVGFASHDGTYSIDFASYTIGNPSHPAGTKLDVPASIIVRTRSPSPSGFDSARHDAEHAGADNNGTSSGTETPLRPEEAAEKLTQYCVHKILDYEEDHLYKFMGVGISKEAVKLCPSLPAQLWAVLDSVPLVFSTILETPLDEEKVITLTVDEVADSMARKCLMCAIRSLNCGSIGHAEHLTGTLVQASSLASRSDTETESRWTAAAMCS